MGAHNSSHHQGQKKTKSRGLSSAPHSPRREKGSGRVFSSNPENPLSNSSSESKGLGIRATSAEANVQASSCPMTSDIFSLSSSSPVPDLSFSKEKLPRRVSCESRKSLSSISGPSTLQWQKGSLIGTGACGKVFLAINQNSGEFMAVKEVHIDSNAEKEVVESIAGEIEMMRDLKHPNIVGYLGASLEPTKLCIFLEYAGGGSIAKILETYGPLNEKLTSVYTRQILQGLQYLHKHSIVHRDVKGHNCLVDTNGAVKLADFGAATRLECLDRAISDRKSPLPTHSKELRGTPQFMAPEVIMQKPYDSKADIWSLGCTVYEMLTAKIPFANLGGGNPQALMFRIAQDHATGPCLPSNIQLSKNGHKFLILCFNQNPNRRPSSTHLLSDPFVCQASCPPPAAATSSLQSELSPEGLASSYLTHFSLPSSADNKHLLSAPRNTESSVALSAVPERPLLTINHSHFNSSSNSSCNSSENSADVNLSPGKYSNNSRLLKIPKISNRCRLNPIQEPIWDSPNANQKNIPDNNNNS